MYGPVPGTGPNLEDDGPYLLATYQHGGLPEIGKYEKIYGQ